MSVALGNADQSLDFEAPGLATLGVSSHISYKASGEGLHAAGWAQDEGHFTNSRDSLDVQIVHKCQTIAHKPLLGSSSSSESDFAGIAASLDMPMHPLMAELPVVHMLITHKGS